MLAIAIEDARRMIIPDWLSLPMIGTGLVAAAWLEGGHLWQAVTSHALAAAGAALVLLAVRGGYRNLRGREGLGLGDVKLAAVAGVWIGPEGVAHAFLAACIGALGLVAARRAMGGKAVSGTSALPFGLFLAPAIWLKWVLDKAVSEGILG